jgi:hypothetical protein
MFKRIGVRYVIWHNRKYGRTGPLFQGRYKSEAVEDDGYLLSALRYIHSNPVEARMCGKPEDYRWSSYRDYLGKGGGITDTHEILLMFGRNASEGIAAFREFMDAEAPEHLDIHPKTDEAMRERIENLCGVSNIAQFQALSVYERNSNIQKLRTSGLSIRQIARLTGIPFGVVRRIR